MDTKGHAGQGRSSALQNKQYSFTSITYSYRGKKPNPTHPYSPNILKRTKTKHPNVLKPMKKQHPNELANSFIYISREKNKSSKVHNFKPLHALYMKSLQSLLCYSFTDLVKAHAFRFKISSISLFSFFHPRTLYYTKNGKYLIAFNSWKLTEMKLLVTLIHCC